MLQPKHATITVAGNKTANQMLLQQENKMLRVFRKSCMSFWDMDPPHKIMQFNTYILIPQIRTKVMWARIMSKDEAEPYCCQGQFVYEMMVKHIVKVFYKRCSSSWAMDPPHKIMQIYTSRSEYLYIDPTNQDKNDLGNKDHVKRWSWAMKFTISICKLLPKGERKRIMPLRIIRIQALVCIV